MRIKTLEKQYEHTLAEKTVKHKNEIEVLWFPNVYCIDTAVLLVQDLISRFKDSAQIEEDFKKASKLLKVAKKTCKQ